MSNFIDRGLAKASRLTARATASRRLTRLDTLVADGLPAELLPALRFLISRKPDADAAVIRDAAEARRAEIASTYEDGVEVWYSPKPGSAGEEVGEAVRPEPGQVMHFTAERVAATGKDKRWGTAMYLIARGFECSSGLELGTCAGMSALYVAAAPSMTSYLTVEGSSGLCDIARDSLTGLPEVRVINAMFDDALDDELPRLAGRLDFAFIDGHHERVATIHYADRIMPTLADGAVVIFDDISWSADMRRAWDDLRTRPEWAHAIDLGAIGVCIYSPGSAEPRQWDMQPLLGKTPIGEPWGWKG